MLRQFSGFTAAADEDDFLFLTVGHCAVVSEGQSSDINGCEMNQERLSGLR